MKKILGEQRRTLLLEKLKQINHAVTGADLAKFANVSRQVIVNDMNLLKARNEPIVATSQGYIYLKKDNSTRTFEQKIVSYHPPEKTEDELFTIVDCGATVKNVIVEHPVYGEITANLHVSNRLEVESFLMKVNETNAQLLSALTDGTHLHVISAPSEEILTTVINKLREKGFILEN